MLKTRVAHGYCARRTAAGTCPYANICETCDNYITAPEFRGALTDQLADIQDLKADAESRHNTRTRRLDCSTRGHTIERTPTPPPWAWPLGSL